MKTKILKTSICVLSICLSVLFSCKKDLASKEYPNQPPIAIAGVDQTIELPENTYIRGHCSIFFKQVIQDGKSSFTGTFKITEGTAWSCNHAIYENLLPLTVTGNLDATNILLT